MSQIQISIDEESLSLLDQAAEASSFSRDTALKRAIYNYAEYVHWVKDKVDEGLRAYETGDVYSNEEVEREAEALNAEIAARIKR